MENRELHKDHRSRMRARFRKNGLSDFKDHEILEVLLYPIIPRRNTNDIAHDLLDRFGDLLGVFTADEEELRGVDGIGDSAAAYIRFLGECFSGLNADTLGYVPLDNDEAAGMYATLRTGFSPRESALAVYLDKKGIRISEEWLCNGKDKMTDELASYIIRRANEFSCDGILLIHNHMHDPPHPSSEDETVTRQLRENAKSCGISTVRHVIVSDEGYVHI